MPLDNELSQYTFHHLAFVHLRTLEYDKGKMGLPNFITPPESSTSRAQSLHRHDIVSERLEDHETLRLIGTTRSEPRSDVKTILITGGAGFM